jgi:hypothetical protein
MTPGEIEWLKTLSDTVLYHIWLDQYRYLRHWHRPAYDDRPDKPTHLQDIGDVINCCEREMTTRGGTSTDFLRKMRHGER